MTRHLFPVVIAALSAGVVPGGRPIRVRLDAVAVVKPGADVHGVIVDPLYVRDHRLVASGATVTGHVEHVQPASGWSRAWALTGGDLTPGRSATVRFDTLTLADGSRMRIDAVAPARTDEVELRPAWWKDYLLGQLPYHRRYLHAGTVLTVQLVEPLSIADDHAVAPAVRGRVTARLLTAIDSRSARNGETVRAALLEPVMSADGRLVAAEGDEVEGIVTAVRRAGAFGRTGHVAFRIGRVTHVERGSPLSAVRFVWPPLAILSLLGARTPDSPDASTVFGRGGAGWSGFELVGAAVAQVSAPVAIGFGVWGLARATYVNVLAKGHDVVLPAGSVIVLDR